MSAASTLKWLREPAFRRRVGAGLNKGEARHKLPRAVFFNRLGQVRDRAFEEQQNRASGLNLVMQATTIWNTVYIDLAIRELPKQRHVDDSLLQHVSPLGWERIILTGDYDWAAASSSSRASKGHCCRRRQHRERGGPAAPSRRKKLGKMRLRTTRRSTEGSGSLDGHPLAQRLRATLNESPISSSRRLVTG